MIATIIYQQLHRNAVNEVCGSTVYAGQVKSFACLVDWFDCCDSIRSSIGDGGMVLQATDGQTFVLTDNRVDM